MTDVAPCPRCGAAGSGNFCSECGASRGSAPCTACGHTPEAGARFCTRCGQALNSAAPAAAAGPVAASTAPASGHGGATREGALGWWIAGLALVALILFVAYPVISGPGDAGAPARPGGAGGGAPAMQASPDVLNMDPREAADRLYDRVMRAASAGDSAEVAMFLPMSIAAYDRARPLDADGLYHLSVLQRTAGDDAAALATAREVLADTPAHLLALGAAAEAAEGAGETEAAREYWQRIVDVYDDEMAAGRPEYADHAPLMDQLLERARSATGG